MDTIRKITPHCLQCGSESLWYMHQDGNTIYYHCNKCSHDFTYDATALINQEQFDEEFKISKEEEKEIANFWNGLFG